MTVATNALNNSTYYIHKSISSSSNNNMKYIDSQKPKESDLSPTKIHQMIQPIKTMKRLLLTNKFWSDINGVPLLVKDIRKASLYGDPTQRFIHWSNNFSTSSIQHLASTIVAKALDNLDNLKQLTHLKLGFSIFRGVFYQELPLDTIFLACPLLHTLITTKCIILYNNDNNISSDPDNENDSQETLKDSHGTIPMTTATGSLSAAASSSASS
ncbi:hypothetical protein BDC45DRAFT_537009 [Circinella umbellata]|nr:hypothetical protein BDC45DRAFT_537009 [Circinella umbellata]